MKGGMEDVDDTGGGAVEGRFKGDVKSTPIDDAFRFGTTDRGRH